MFRKFSKESCTWEGIERHIYKENPGVFRDATKTVLFDNEGDLPVQFRYFQIEKDGFSSLEHHEHMHMVIIFRGSGHVLLGHEVKEVHEGDLITIPSWQWHQFRADRGEMLGFFCLVRHERDIPQYPAKEELDRLQSYPEVKRFLEQK